MGLDAYLIKVSRETKQKQDILYWRKGYPIHDWMYYNNTEPHISEIGRFECIVPYEKLYELMKICGMVLKAALPKSVAKKLFDVDVKDIADETLYEYLQDSQIVFEKIPELEQWQVYAENAFDDDSADFDDWQLAYIENTFRVLYQELVMNKKEVSKFEYRYEADW